MSDSKSLQCKTKSIGLVLAEIDLVKTAPKQRRSCAGLFEPQNTFFPLLVTRTASPAWVTFSMTFDHFWQGCKGSIWWFCCWSKQTLWRSCLPFPGIQLAQSEQKVSLWSANAVQRITPPCVRVLRSLWVLTLGIYIHHQVSYVLPRHSKIAPAQLLAVLARSER